MLYVYVPIVEIRYEHFQDLITTLSSPIHAWGIDSSRRLVSHCLSRLPPPDFPASVEYLSREILLMNVAHTGGCPAVVLCAQGGS